MLRLSLLIEIDAHHEKDRAHQDQGVAQFTEKEIDDRSTDQQQNHGLAYYVPGGSKQIASFGGRQFVEAFGP
jgi:hypothetical protein